MIRVILVSMILCFLTGCGQESSSPAQAYQPIQPEKLERIRLAMSEGEIIILFGNPGISVPYKSEDSAAKVLFYCLVPVRDTESEKDKFKMKPVEACSVPIVIEDGGVVGYGWDFFRDYIQSHQLMWEVPFETLLSGCCSAGKLTRP